MADPHHSRRWPAALGAAAGGLLLTGALHASAPRLAADGVAGELLHLAPAVLVAALYLLLARLAGRAPRTRTLLAVLVVAGVGPELLAAVRESATHGHDDGLAHLLHAAPPVLALLGPAVVAAIGISWILALACRPGTPLRRPASRTDVASRPGRAFDLPRPGPARAGRSAGRAPPHPLAV
ncbi:hypothetical protein [Patulibacter minatonensis]|uniref:hypothetical protein n=1 Tax=Patulibacter minatonensis TaxID=298163 RepID=UPI000479CE27|nr:hypothetical protein [Patulibacter minatonensis]